MTEGTAISVKCTLATLPAAGTWDVTVSDVSGKIPIKAGVAKIAVSVSVTSVTPNTNLNQMGGDELTIVGTNFDFNNMKSNTVALEDGTTCAVTEVTAIKIVCTTGAFVKTTAADLAKDIKVVVTVNAKVDNS